MSRQKPARAILSRLRVGSLALAHCAFVAGCGVYNYQLGAQGGSGESSGGGSGESSGGGSGESSGGGSGESSGGGGGETTGGTSGAAGGTGGTTGMTGAASGLIGWASVIECGPQGTTGGDEGPTVRPKTPQELDDAVRAAGPSVVEISGKLELGSVIPQISGDKTLVGVSGAELVGSVRVLNARNVIIRNIRFNGGGLPSNVDAVEVDNSTCVWLDHCEFFDGGDDNLDIVRGSDLVTVSWSKFYYVTKTGDRRFGSLCGNSITDWPGRINVTFHHNWWAEGLLADMPSVRHGKVHIFNSYFSSAGNESVIAAGYMSKLLVQNNVFDTVNNPIVFYSDEDTAEVVETGNDYSTATGQHVSRGTSFEPPYAYTLESAAAARLRVTAEAGRQ